MKKFLRWIPLVLWLLTALLVLRNILVVPQGTLEVRLRYRTGGDPINGLEIRVDDETRCRSFPCQLKLNEGLHRLEIEAPGFQSEEDSQLLITADKHHISQVALVRPGTGVMVFGEAKSPLLLSIDEQAKGSLPLRIADMTPGQHLVEVRRGWRYEPWRLKVNVPAGRIVVLGPIDPGSVVAKRLVTLRASESSEHAEIVMKTAQSSTRIPSLPVRLALDSKSQHVLIARKPGFKVFRKRLVMPKDSPPHLEVTVELVPLD